MSTVFCHMVPEAWSKISVPESAFTRSIFETSSVTAKCLIHFWSGRNQRMHTQLGRQSPAGGPHPGRGTRTLRKQFGLSEVCPPAQVLAMNECVRPLCSLPSPPGSHHPLALPSGISERRGRRGH